MREGRGLRPLGFRAARPDSGVTPAVVPNGVGAEEVPEDLGRTGGLGSVESPFAGRLAGTSRTPPVLTLGLSHECTWLPGSGLLEASAVRAPCLGRASSGAGPSDTFAQLTALGTPETGGSSRYSHLMLGALPADSRGRGLVSCVLQPRKLAPTGRVSRRVGCVRLASTAAVRAELLIVPALGEGRAALGLAGRFQTQTLGAIGAESFPCNRLYSRVRVLHTRGLVGWGARVRRWFCVVC